MRPLSDSRQVAFPSGRPLSILLSTSAIAFSLLNACGEATAEVTPTTSVATTTTSHVTTTAAEVTTTLAVSTTSTTAATTTTTVSVEKLARAEEVGDVAAGEELFFTPLDGINQDLSCANCHSLDGTEVPHGGPSLLGVSDVAGDRVEGLSDIEYLHQSIIDPYAFDAVDDSTYLMPYQYANVLTEQQINNLVAFLLTR